MGGPSHPGAGGRELRTLPFDAAKVTPCGPVSVALAAVSRLGGGGPRGLQGALFGG